MRQSHEKTRIIEFLSCAQDRRIGGGTMGRTMKGTAYQGLGRTKGPGNGEKGFILLIVMILIVALTLLGLAANRNILTDIGIATNHAGSTKALYGAEAAADLRLQPARQYLQTGVVVPAHYTVAVNTIAGFPGASFAVDTLGTSVLQSLSSGTYKGLNSWTQKYRISAANTDSGTNATTMVTLDVDNKLIPVFQFGIFYNSDLEIEPGANLTVPKNGWIHSNGNLYTSTSATESILSHITSAGENPPRPEGRRSPGGGNRRGEDLRRGRHDVP